MLHRRLIAIPALLLAATGLTSCGFDYATDRVNQIGAGDNERSAPVDALGIQILSDSPGEGRLIGALVNNTDEAASLDAIADENGTVTAEIAPVEVRPRAHVNLATEVDDPIRLTGEFIAGDMVPLTFEFSTGDTVVLNVPVVKKCFYYDQVELSQDDPGDEETHSAAYLCSTEIPTPGAEEEEGH